MSVGKYRYEDYLDYVNDWQENVWDGNFAERNKYMTFEQWKDFKDNEEDEIDVE